MEGPQGQKSAIVVGAGVGGVATAARLAKAGLKVTVVEKNGFTGGRCSLIYYKDYRFDQGPSFLLLPDFFYETFQDLGTSIEDEGVEMLQCPRNYNVSYSDGQFVHLSTDLARMKAEIEKWEGKDGFERYLAYLQEAHRHYELSVKFVLRKNFTSIFSMLRPGFVKAFFDLHVLQSIYTRASKYFWTERLRRAFTFSSMYLGMSPFDAPGTYSLLQYTELAEGIWYPKGGFHKIVDALVNFGKRSGVEFRMSSPVKSILLSADQKQAKGIILESGEELHADIVIANADLVYTYNNLLPSSDYAKSLEKRPASCSSVSFYWALDRCFPELSIHNIFLADDYKDSFDEIFKEQTLPKEPSFYINVPSRIDPTAAPEGKDSVVVLVPVGHLVDDDQHDDSDDAKGRPGLHVRRKQDWEAMISRVRTFILKTLEQRLNISLSEHIVNEYVNSPQDWKERFNLDKGAILGLSHSFFNVLSFRPRTQHPSIKNLHFVGASTHPGTGVPICLAGAKLTSEQVLGRLGIRVPWEVDASVDKVRRNSTLDKVHPAMPGHVISVIVLLLAILSAILWMRV
ncbi:phytoene desaturase [Xylona heveae TC161]|uniref:Phytoene desaturase n=1 Tax=Xylona heveae (strain CBS 132557 / TC161) TaxID=1328760 RepID=A0A165AH32_XYLHT|nr:phytoene desaturase [Xylona heveae TC161]KZF20460.1 phytoene desaturase [Xylona heveae TC161]